MNLIYEKLSQTLAAAAVWPLFMAGDEFRIAAAQWPVNVELRKNGQVIGTMSNMLAGDYVRDVPFDAVVITNGSTAQQVTVQIVGGGVGSDRVLGEVSVIDGGKQRVLSGASFFYGGTQAAVAAQYAYVGVFNAAAAGGKNIIVNQIGAKLSGVASCILRRSAAAVGAVGVGGASKFIGGAASVIGIGYSGSNAVLGAGFLAYGGRYTPGQTNFFRPTEPMIVPPGTGLYIEVDTVNIGIDSASFDGFEEVAA